MFVEIQNNLQNTITGKKVRYRSVICSFVLKMCVFAWYTFLKSGQIAIVNILPWGRCQRRTGNTFHCRYTLFYFKKT